MQQRAVVAASILVAALAFWSYRPWVEINNSVPFSGDSWNYQSLAVNLARGHGYVEGAAEPFSVYRFATRNAALHYPIGEAPASFYDYFMQGAKYRFYRTPGYPAFMAAVYSLCGIEPAQLRRAQMLLLSLSASLLVLIAYLCWERWGIPAGLLSSYLFMHAYAPDPHEIMSESLAVFSLACWALACAAWQRAPASSTRVLLLALASVTAIFVRGSALGLVLLVLPAFFVWLERSTALRRALLYLGAVAALIAPWSVYASLEQGRLVLLSTYHESLLIDSNNESTLASGSWNPDWRKQRRGDPRFLANRPEAEGLSSTAVVARFLWIERDRVPQLLQLKLRRAFGRWPVWAPIALMSLFLGMAWARARVPERTASIPAAALRAPAFALPLLGNILLITLVFYGSQRFVQPFMPFFVLVACHAPIVILLATLGLLRRST